MQLDRVGSTLALHRTQQVCVHTVRALAGVARMFTEYVDPLSSLRHTYELARRSSFTPICLRSRGTIQPRGTGLDLLHLGVRTYFIYVCGTIVSIVVLMNGKCLPFVYYDFKYYYDCSSRLFSGNLLSLSFKRKKIKRFSENCLLLCFFYYVLKMGSFYEYFFYKYIINIKKSLNFWIDNIILSHFSL